ncbi:hypothetical protein AVI51_14220 [Piscirickettsia salmonis]|uniref:Uncharacterized protein n=1 Tax=Piscirickettsia salmonis TaxID=1238 RepID=A0A9Q6LU06_PISSA|nr:hypothetical protein KW89_714 [Piscirickettsia salmonis]APS44575.1 hypothetical protein AVI48_09490 [Piscirickettsia salmonis]APS47937.1 hypothetical protein AVI49_10100 [Piscirickettsia salmonis]APS51893.1 hypothetical protein AVI50_14360 [Piscirickettsia salmonis]APS55110.1 hypothetical protein AVI51_14220 [Piscirickettsia salmonis]
MTEGVSHNCKEKASFFLIVFFNLLILCQKLLIERYISAVVVKNANEINAREWIQKFSVEFEASLTQSVDRCFKREYYQVNMVN